MNRSLPRYELPLKIKPMKNIHHQLQYKGTAFILHMQIYLVKCC